MKTGIIVTSHCSDPYYAEKLLLTERLCEALSLLNLPLCLASHTTMPEKIQQLCNGYIYDSDNTFHINNQPANNRTHGLAELKSIHNGVNFLTHKFNITHFLKLTYDISSNVPFSAIIERCEKICSGDIKMISCQWNTREPSISTMCYYSEIDFFNYIFSLSEVSYYKNQFEVSLYQKFKKYNVLDKIQIEGSYNNFLGFKIKHNIHWAGKLIEPDWHKI